MDSALAVTHTPDVLDAQDVFAIVDGDLRVTTGRGGVYSLAGGDVRGSGSLLSGTVTAEARVFVSQPEDEVAFAYDHNGLRVRGTVTAEARVFVSQPEDEVAYSYDHNGLRVRKKMTRYGGAEETTDYTLHGKLVTHLVKWNVTAEYVETVDEMHFFYDAQSRPAMASLNGTMYTYVHNLQGDVVGLLDEYGTLVVEYQYDAWGRPIETWSKADAGLESSLISEYALLKELNPFRYRGYVWDEETGLYYLRSRYYEPVWGRFLNADCMLDKPNLCGGCNLYTYCLNNSVRLIDKTGAGSKDSAITIIESNIQNVIEAAEQYTVDPALVASLVYTEITTNGDIVDIFTDNYGLYGINTSVGIGQVRFDTAKMLEDKGYVKKTRTRYGRWIRLMMPKTNLIYVAAYAKYLQDEWENAFPEIVGRPDIIGTLYAGAGNSIPHANPQSNQFGRMVMKNMYRMQEILGVDIGSYYIDRESGKRVEILLS